ncbi:MAG: phosphoglycerate kinase [Elusimicrobiota bacterium]
MSIRKKSFRELNVTDRRVLVRVDFNVPVDKNTGLVTDDSRLRAALPTIERLLEKKAKVILISHLGRPKGQVNPKYSLKPVLKPLSDLLKLPVQFADNCVGPLAYEAVAKLKAGDVLLLENLRFHEGEEKNNQVFAKDLSTMADYFVQDAFGAVHRAHASTSAITSFLPSFCGSLLEKELNFLGKVKSNPARPYVAILGGAKVSDKIAIVESFVNNVDVLFIGGAMAYTFLRAKGIETGDSLVELDFISVCQNILKIAEEKGVKIILPVDHKIVQQIENPSQLKHTNDDSIPLGWKGVDIGPETLNLLKPELEKAKTVFWNGPSGIFEINEFSVGTMTVAHLAAKAAMRGAIVVVGGGDSVAAVVKAGVSQQITYISTGGGASMEFLEGKELPGVVALPNS